MALKKLMLARSIELEEQALKEMEEAESDFSTRETELRTAIEEAQTAEERTAVEEAVTAFDAEITAHRSAVTAQREKLEEMRSQLAAMESDVPPAPAVEQKKTENERNDVKMLNLNIRSLPRGQRCFDALDEVSRRSIFEQQDVKDFLAQMRSFKGNTRAVSGGDLLIPQVMLELISENMFRYSKLLNRVRVRNVSGQARQTVAGVIPEAVWTEMCDAINELDISFGGITLDGYKVAGYTAVCNALLADSDFNLAAAVTEMLSEAVGLAIDKAILYGKGSAYRMPMGIVTRLAQTSKPADYPASAPAWTDLHTSNILSIGGADVTGATFWAQLMGATGATYTTYSRGETFWAMNSKTLAALRAKVITFTAGGDIAANIYGTLPIINGNIEVLEFMPDGDIVGGYGDLYLWANREGMSIESGRQLIQDNTIFVGKARADGAPIVAGAFVAININNTAVTTAMNFAADTANDAKLSALTLSGVTLSPTFDGSTYTYTGTTTTAAAKVEAVAAQPDAQIGITFNGAPVRNGQTVTQTSGAGNVYAITVKQGNAVRVYNITVTATLG